MEFIILLDYLRLLAPHFAKPPVVDNESAGLGYLASELSIIEQRPRSGRPTTELTSTHRAWFGD